MTFSSCVLNIYYSNDLNRKKSQKSFVVVIEYKYINVYWVNWNKHLISHLIDWNIWETRNEYVNKIANFSEPSHQSRKSFMLWVYNLPQIFNHINKINSIDGSKKMLIWQFFENTIRKPQFMIGGDWKIVTNSVRWV